MVLTLVSQNAIAGQEISCLFDRLLPNRALLHMALSGQSDAAVIVDEEQKPSRCLIRTGFNGFSFYAGERDGFLDVAVRRMRAGAQVTLIWPEEWKGDGGPPEGFQARIDRVEFTNRDVADSDDPPVPDGCKIVPITPALFDRCLWRREFAGTCHPPVEFFGAAPGLCLVRGEELLCEAYAAWWGSGLCEIGAITHEEHQRKGYAKVTCTHLARKCESLGFSTTWTCHSTNEGSVGTARSLGYKSVRHYELIEYSPS